MDGIYMLATNGLENLGVLKEVGEGIFRFEPELNVYFYDKRYEGPKDEALALAVQAMLDKREAEEEEYWKEVGEYYRQLADTKKEDNPSPLDYV